MSGQHRELSEQDLRVRSTLVRVLIECFELRETNCAVHICEGRIDVRRLRETAPHSREQHAEGE